MSYERLIDPETEDDLAIPALIPKRAALLGHTK